MSMDTEQSMSARAFAPRPAVEVGHLPAPAPAPFPPKRPPSSVEPPSGTVGPLPAGAPAPSPIPTPTPTPARAPVAAPPVRPPRPPRPARIDAGWCWYGLHGGAGVTTLLAAVPGGADLHSLPSQHGHPAMPVVAVCRSHAGGLRAAQRWAAWVSDHPAAVNLLGLVVVADAPGRLPRSLESTIRLVTGGYPRVWRIPFVQLWRVGEPPSAANLPTAGRQLRNDLARQTGLALTGGT